MSRCKLLANWATMIKSKALFLLDTLLKGDVLANLAKGNANLYFTPNDMDLNING
jgi:hypothetical protein